MRARYVFAVCVVLALGVTVYGLLNDDGYSKTRRLETETAELQARLDALTAEHERLTREVRALQDDGDQERLEQLVRDELGYVRNDETVLLVAPTE